MTQGSRRFSLRQGIEVTPEQPILEDAPDRLRFFVLDFLRNSIAASDALIIVARVFCLPKMLLNPPLGVHAWLRIGEEIDTAEWWSVFNLLEEIYRTLSTHPAISSGSFVRQLNSVFSEESIGWMMEADGQLQRLLPAPLQIQSEAVFRELQAPRWVVALGHVVASHSAYNKRPRRDREVCSEIFDALESVGKEVFDLPTGTFGDVIKQARLKEIFAKETLAILEKTYALANNHFRHGMTEPFTLTPAEVDFVYVSTMGGVLLLVRHFQSSQ